MKASLTLSFLLHIILVLAFQKAFPLQWNLEPLRTYAVELIRPSVEDIDMDEPSQTLREDLKQEEDTSPLDAQDTISLDTKDKRYVSYAKIIKGEIMRHWRYPPQARAYLIEGSLTALFTLSRNGAMTQIRITKVSGQEILDKEVIRAINKAAPFPPFPSSVTVSRLNIQANFDYRLTSKQTP